MLWELRDHFVEDDWGFARQGTARGSQAEETARAKAQSCERLEQSVRWDVSWMSPEGFGG